MKALTFEKIWERIILPQASSIVENLHAVCLIKDLEAYKVELFRIYNEEKANTKCLMEFKSDSIEKRIDHHKIAAVFYLALVKKPLIVAAMNGKLQSMGDWDCLANHYLAWRTALSVLLSFMVHKERRDNSLSDYGAYLEQNGLQIPGNDPKVSCCHEGTYEVQTLKALYQAFKADQLNVFLLANILYLYEAYTLNTYSIQSKSVKGKSADDK